MCITRIGFFCRRIKPFQVHQAAHVVGGEHLRARLFVVGNAVVPHHAGNGLLVHGERAAEAAAFVGAAQLHQFNALRAFPIAIGPC